MHGPAFLCRACESLQSLVKRHLGDLKVLQKLDATRQAEFFRKNTEKNDNAGKASWDVVRSCLVTELVSEVRKEWDSGCTGEWLPESVWVARGFLSDSVRNCPSKETEHLGVVYQVPVEHDNFRVLRQDIERGLLRKEEDCREAKRGKKAAAGQGAQDQPPAEDWFLPAASSSAKGTGKGNGKKDRLAQAAPKAAASAKIARDNCKTNLQAQKALAELTGTLVSLEKLKNQVAKRDDAPPELAAGVEDALQVLSSWKAACQAVTLQYSAVAGQDTQPLLPALPFDDQAFKTKVKAAKALRHDLPRKPKVEPKPKAAAESNEPLPKRRRCRGGA